MTRITIAGPGGTFGEIVHIVQNALEEAGVDTSVQDEHPATAHPERLMELAKGSSVEIVVKHMPWGG